ncbi:hypothetical protein BHE97_09135 [Aeromicrobium sp. PE09-221]|uniref:DUF6328 family protein n=1 Tax=Aeromicrobium sp. PE09-221 TaxID=1898043 RepID=UPI000B70B3CE|nr:DUF6328 family protein [Aeromicrobium sp. PE09-221]OUZ09962.1 hypothetical protein BHE97_09135 [Aeromicrobium sp. PE09-221]
MLGASGGRAWRDVGSTAPGTPRGARLDRNWNELLQELRVAQTGVQILTAFRLTVPFPAVLVAAVSRLSLLGLGPLGVANAGAAWLVVDVVLGTVEAFIVAGLMVSLAAMLWWAMPMMTRRAHRR